MLRKPKAWALTLATIFAAGCAHSDNTSGIRSVQWKGGKAPRQGPVQPAVEPKILPETYFAAAQLLEREGEFANAAIQYRKATAVNHNYVAAYHRLGVLLTKMGVFDEAIQSLATAAKLAPENALLRNDYGFALMLHKKWDEAAEQFRQCIDRRPDFARAYINLGMTQARMDRFDDAFQSFRAVLAEPDAYYNLGLMYRARGRNADASTAFRKALAINPDFYAAAVQLNDVDDRPVPSRSTAPPAGDNAPRLISRDLTPVDESPSVERPPVSTVEPRTAVTVPSDHGTPTQYESRAPQSMETVPGDVEEMQEVDAPVSQRDEQRRSDHSNIAVAPARNPVPPIRPLAEQPDPATEASRTNGRPSVDATGQVNDRIAMRTMDPLEEEPTLATTTQQPPPVASSWPQPNRNPEYVIQGPEKNAPRMETMREVRAETPSVETEGHTVGATRIATRVPPSVSPVSTDAWPAGVSEDHTVGITLALGDNTCFAYDVEADGDDTIVTSTADYAADVLRRTPADDWGQPSRTLPPVDSEAIIRAFETHVYAFADVDLCWDEIDWQSWDVIDADAVASRQRYDTAYIGTMNVIDTSDRVAQHPQTAARPMEPITNTPAPDDDTKSFTYGGRTSARVESSDADYGDFMVHGVTERTANPQAGSGSSPPARIVPGLDDEGEMAPVTPPIEIRQPAANLPVLVRQESHGQDPAHLAEAPTPEVDSQSPNIEWRSTFGSLEDTAATVLNEIDRQETKVVKMEPVKESHADRSRNKRPTLSSKIVEMKPE